MSASKMLQPDALVGAWSLRKFEITFSDDRPPVYPFGADASGRLIYAASGQMSAVLSSSGRARLDVTRLETFSTATDAAKAEAFDSYLSYAGRWKVAEDGTSVTHIVELAMVPNIVGREQQRQAALDGDELHLSYEITAKSGVVRTYNLYWLRAKQVT